VGLTEDEIRQIDHWPEGRGLLGLLIKEPQPLRLATIADHAESSGFPAGHPPMESFLGVPVRVRDVVFGNLYLTNKRGGGEFTEDDEAVLLALGAAAGVAIENARLYEASRRSQRWIQASAEVTTALLSGTEPGEVLARITSQARELSDADLAILALPDEEDRRLTVAYADGDIVALVEEMTAMLGFAPSLRLGPGLRALRSEELTDQALIVLREALSNTARHAGATRADVMVDVDPDGFLTVTVTDDGTGIPSEGRRSGLRNLAGRAAELGGELRLSPAEPGALRPGTRLEWRVPAAVVPTSGHRRPYAPDSGTCAPDRRRAASLASR
jgi:GAF domain-containing protein